jgi:hypothetical protein
MPLVGVRQQVRELRTANPHWSLADLAQATNPPVTRERVRQLLVAEGLHTARVTPRRVFDAALKGLDVREHNPVESPDGDFAAQMPPDATDPANDT